MFCRQDRINDLAALADRGGAYLVTGRTTEGRREGLRSSQGRSGPLAWYQIKLPESRLGRFAIDPEFLADALDGATELPGEHIREEGHSFAAAVAALVHQSPASECWHYSP